MNLKQPAVGIVSTLLVSAVSLAFISLFDFPTFVGWVSFYLMCVVTVLIVMLALWRTEHPRFAATHPQPLKGVATALVAMAGGAVVCALFFFVVGQGISPPAPMLMEFTVASVVVTFIVCIPWGGWPANALVRTPVPAGLLQLFIGYAVNYLLFRTLFNYAFMQGAPVYVASLDPQGMFSAAQVLPLYVSVLAAMFLILGFDVWPLTTNPALMKQPLLGAVWTLLILAIGGAIFYTGTVIFAMDPMIYLVSVPVPFLFGSIVVLNMLDNSLFARRAQPTKGALNVLAAIGCGGALSLIFSMVMPAVSGALPSGPPAYAAQLWVANALLAVTFPFLVIYAAFLNFWPLRKVDVPVSQTHPEPS
jgi:hypothetical protein